MEPGIYPGITNHAYHTDPKYTALSKSWIEKLLISPAHLYAYRQQQEPPTKEMVFGSAFHAFALEPDTAEREVEVRGSVKKGDRDAASAQGLYLITQDEMDAINYMKDSLWKSPGVQGLFSDGDAEVSCFWNDARYGYPCKSRIDWRSGGLQVMADLKSCQDASPAGFAKACANYGYDVQAAHYTDGEEAITGDVSDFLFIAVEKSAPWAVALYRASEEMIENGRRKINTIREVYAKCLKTDQWPGFGDHIFDIDLPRWAMVA